METCTMEQANPRMAEAEALLSSLGLTEPQARYLTYSAAVEISPLDYNIPVPTPPSTVRLLPTSCPMATRNMLVAKSLVTYDRIFTQEQIDHILEQSVRNVLDGASLLHDSAVGGRIDQDKFFDAAVCVQKARDAICVTNQQRHVLTSEGERVADLLAPYKAELLAIRMANEEARRRRW